MKFLTRTGVSFEKKTRMNSFWDDLCGNEMSFWYPVNKYGLRNMKMEQTHFRIKAILVSCEKPLNH